MQGSHGFCRRDQRFYSYKRVQMGDWNDPTKLARLCGFKSLYEAQRKACFQEIEGRGDPKFGDGGWRRGDKYTSFGHGDYNV